MSLFLSTIFATLLATTLLAAPAQHPTGEPDGKPFGAVLSKDHAKGPRLLFVSPRQRFNRDYPTGLPDLPQIENSLIPNTTYWKQGLSAWQNEAVSVQILIESPEGFTAPPPRLRDFTLISFDNKIVQEDAYALSCSPIRYTTGNGVLIPDIVETSAEFELINNTPTKGIVRPFLLTLWTFDLKPGLYFGMVSFSVNGTQLCASFPIVITKAKLPNPADWKFHLDLWQHPDAVARWHDVPMWSSTHCYHLYNDLVKPLGLLGQKTITCTLIDEAWQEQTYDRFRSMIAISKTREGSWHFDYSAFDQWVETNDDSTVMRNATINCYTMIPWSLTFPYFDWSTHTILKPKLVPGTPEYEAFWGPYLTDFVAHLKEKGWLKRTRIAMDERPDHLLKPALEVLKKYAPELKIVAACDRPSAINRDFDDVSYAYDHIESLLPELKERQAQGKTTTFYTCLHPVRPNTLMHSDLAESEWMMPMAANYGLDGMLRWAFNSWEENPLQSMDHVRFPSGDTALIYPRARFSMRLFAIRDGIETYEKIRILHAEAQKQGKPEVLEPLEKALAVFTVARGKQQGVHEQDLIQLDTALNTVTQALYSGEQENE